MDFIVTSAVDTSSADSADVPDPHHHASLDRLVGASAAMRALRDRLPRIARASGSVLVHGRSGTGKELVARLVHDLSPRARGPFVAVDCGALTESLLESELFGHARGAFTGSQGDRRGLFEEAEGGTLFLDEIANTSLAFQARLLRVLQEREVRRVGCNRARRIDVRIVAASNRELAAEVAQGRFREDLLYRLDVLSLLLPTLAERREDVPLLARHLLGEIGRREGTRLEITARAAAALSAHEWPGNVRELRNVLERAAAFATNGVVDAPQLPDRIGARLAGATERPALADLVESFERTLLIDRLEVNRWNRTKTAAEFGITRRCLFNKILKHQLRPVARTA